MLDVFKHPKMDDSKIIQYWMILVINSWMNLVWLKIHPKLDDSCHQFMDDSCREKF